MRGGVAILMLVSNELLTSGPTVRAIIRVAALVALLVNVPYYLAARSDWRRRLQAWIRMGIDLALMTASLYAAGGLAAAPYLGVYAIVPVYAGIVFSSVASVAVTLVATVAFLALAGAQTIGLLPFMNPPPPHAWTTAVFNLLVLDIVGGLAATLAHAYRRNRQQLATAYDELERAHEQTLRMHAHIECAGRVYAVSELVAGVTHQLRNQVQGALGHLWLVRRKLAAAPDDVHDHLRELETACEQIMRIIRTTLDMARHPADVPGPVSVEQVVAKVVELKVYDVKRDAITLSARTPRTLPRVRVSAVQLQQALLNLITNAHDALRTHEGRREISVVAATDRLGCAIEVRDSGPGIPAAILPQVFEPFFTTKETGAGLGLAIAAAIVERFGGRISAFNRRDGGATFRIVLPAA